MLLDNDYIPITLLKGNNINSVSLILFLGRYILKYLKLIVSKLKF